MRNFPRSRHLRRTDLGNVDLAGAQRQQRALRRRDERQHDAAQPRLRSEVGIAFEDDAVRALPLRHAKWSGAERQLIPRAAPHVRRRKRVRRQDPEREIGLGEELGDGRIPRIAQAHDDRVAIRRLQRRDSPIGVDRFDRIARIDDRAIGKRDVGRRQLAAVGEAHLVPKMIDDRLAVTRDVAVGARGHARHQNRDQPVLRREPDERLRNEQVVADRVLVVREQRIEGGRIDVVGDREHVRLWTRALASGQRRRDQERHRQNG